MQYAVYSMLYAVCCILYAVYCMLYADNLVLASKAIESIWNMIKKGNVAFEIKG